MLPEYSGKNTRVKRWRDLSMERMTEASAESDGEECGESVEDHSSSLSDALDSSSLDSSWLARGRLVQATRSEPTDDLPGGD